MSAQHPPVPPDDFTARGPRRSLSFDIERRSSDSIVRIPSSVQESSETKVPVKRLARHTIGIILLLATVILWTASNFLASTIFADNTYSKPYFVTYVNSSFFTFFLVWVLLKRLWSGKGFVREALKGSQQTAAYIPIENQNENEHPAYTKPANDAETNSYSPQDRLLVDDSMTSLGSSKTSTSDHLYMRETAWLSFEFCLLWFLANYFVAACLEYTTVASSTILASTSGIWTLVFGAILRVESFTVKKLVGTLASLAGIILISSVDLTGETDENRGDFPHKSRRELAIGDALAFGSAVLYGVYTTFMKKKIGDEGRVDMPLFFGFVGLFNLLTLLPGFFFVHITGIETFQLPPTRRITTIVMVNSATSLVGDFCWAYSTLLTSPLVVTVGLSLSIPLSLLGQMIVNGQTSSGLYWIGAVIVLLSFVFINYESKDRSDEDGHARNPRTGPWVFAWRIWYRMNPRRR